MRSDDWSFPTPCEENKKTLKEVIKKLDEILFYVERNQKYLEADDDLQLKFNNKVLFPVIKENEFIDSELNGKYVYGLIKEFIETMELNGFNIVHKDTNERILSYMFE